MTSPSSALIFYIHRTPGISCNLLIYQSDQKTIAYTVTTPSGIIDPFSESPNLFIYRGSPPLVFSEDGPQPVFQPIATATLPKYGTSISLEINKRPIDLPLHTAGLWKYTRAWKSCDGVLRWSYGRFGMGMDLIDEKGNALSQWESDGGGKRIARLEITKPEVEDDPAFVDEIISVSVAIYLQRRRRG